MSDRDGLLRNRWVRSDSPNNKTPNKEKLKFQSLVDKHPPSFDMWQVAVFSIASSKNPMYSANEVWDLDWDDFLAALDWTMFCDAREYAANVDANTPTKSGA